jgi:hypothetical protein
MRFLTIALVLVMLAARGWAGQMEGRLIRAANETAAPDPALHDLAGKLKKVFGYEHYRQLGRDQKALTGTDMLKLNLGEGFTVFCHPHPGPGKLVEMNVEIYSGKTLLVKQEKLAMRPKNVVFIKGPAVGSTLLIVALTLTN